MQDAGIEQVDFYSEEHAASMHDLLKARPRSMAIRLLHDESSTSTANRPTQYREKCARIGVSFHVYMRRGLRGAATYVYIYIDTYIDVQTGSKLYR